MGDLKDKPRAILAGEADEVQATLKPVRRNPAEKPARFCSKTNSANESRAEKAPSAARFLRARRLESGVLTLSCDTDGAEIYIDGKLS